MRAPSSLPIGMFGPGTNPIEAINQIVSVLDEMHRLQQADITELESNNTVTSDGGIYTTMTNGTGLPSVKGSVVTLSSAADKEFVLQSNEYDSLGVVYEDDVPDGEPCKVIVAGYADVLWQDATASTHGQLAIASVIDGRGTGIINPGTGLPAADTHFKEIGHVAESKAAGTDVLVRCILHFN